MRRQNKRVNKSISANIPRLPLIVDPPWLDEGDLTLGCIIGDNTILLKGDLKTAILGESIILGDFLCMLLCLGKSTTLGDLKMHIIEY
jgi:hypothetical protein